jgi:hypothetical protein
MQISKRQQTRGSRAKDRIKEREQASMGVPFGSLLRFVAASHARIIRCETESTKPFIVAIHQPFTVDLGAHPAVNAHSGRGMSDKTLKFKSNAA